MKKGWFRSAMTSCKISVYSRVYKETFVVTIKILFTKSRENKSTIVQTL